MPRISDGQLLFLQHMLSHRKPPHEDGSRVAIIMNGSPLFTGDAGSGESEIRRWILENDWLEALIAMPEQLFYNTGIATYVWVLSNRKSEKRKNKVQLINATSFWTPMRKSLGDKRREIQEDKAAEIVQILQSFKENEYNKIYPTTYFGYRKITVERPLRLNFKASSERIERLNQQSAFINLAVSKKKDPKVRELEENEGRAKQEEIKNLLQELPDTIYKNREHFWELITTSAGKANLRISSAIKKVILLALSERDETAEICLDKDGYPEADPELRDTENVPLDENINEFFERDVKPHVPDAWINTAIRDKKDGGIGRVGYEINFNRYFYTYASPRPLEEIEADIRKIESEIMAMLREVAE